MFCGHRIKKERGLRMKKVISVSVLPVLLVLVLLCSVCELGHCLERSSVLKMRLGGVHDCKGSQNSAEIDSLARFAVQEHNKKAVISLSFLFLFLFSFLYVVCFNGCFPFWVSLFLVSIFVFLLFWFQFCSCEDYLISYHR